PEIVWPHFVVLHGWLLFKRRSITVHGDRRRRKTSIAQRRHSRKRCRVNAGQRFHAIEQFVLKTLRAFRNISRRDQVDGGEQYSLGRKTWAGASDFLKALNE